MGVKPRLGCIHFTWEEAEALIRAAAAKHDELPDDADLDVHIHNNGSEYAVTVYWTAKEKGDG